MQKARWILDHSDKWADLVTNAEYEHGNKAVTARPPLASTPTYAWVVSYRTYPFVKPDDNQTCVWRVLRSMVRSTGGSEEIPCADYTEEELRTMLYQRCLLNGELDG